MTVFTAHWPTWVESWLRSLFNSSSVPWHFFQRIASKDLVTIWHLGRGQIKKNKKEYSICCQIKKTWTLGLVPQVHIQKLSTSPFGLGNTVNSWFPWCNFISSTSKVGWKSFFYIQMVGKVFEHSGNTFKQYQLFYLQNEQLLPALTLTWQTTTDCSRRACLRLSTDWILQPLLELEKLNFVKVKMAIRALALLSSSCLTEQRVCSLTLWGSSQFVHSTFLNLAFSDICAPILRWILGHSMTVNVAVSECTEWDDSIFTTHWKAISAHNGKLK